jgi:hypothetical protein
LYSKLLPKFRELLIDQKAKSVEFELIRAIISSFKNETGEDKEIQMLARERLQGFVQSKDPNRKQLIVTFALVKYLGLLTLKEILEKGD